MKTIKEKIYLTLIAIILVILLEISLFMQKGFFAFIAFFILFFVILKVGLIDIEEIS